MSMNIRKMKKEELESMSYNDIAYLLLKTEKKSSTADLFNEIIDLLEMPKSAFESKIGQFYTSLTNDKRFFLLEDGLWDLRVNHKVSKLIDTEDLEDYEEIEEYDDEYEEDQDKEDIYSEESEEEVNNIAEEYKNLVIIDEEELNEE